MSDRGAVASFALAAWEEFTRELLFVDQEHLKWAFEIVWRARGKADKPFAGSVDDEKAMAVFDMQLWDGG